MHVQGSAQFINHLDVLKKRKGKRAEADKSVQITQAARKMCRYFLDAT
jgi:hypothetical protein